MAQAEAGDIVSIAGMPDATVTDTVCSPEVTAPLPSIPIDPPTIAMTFSVNDSPLGGKTGTKYADVSLPILLTSRAVSGAIDGLTGKLMIGVPINHVSCGI